MNWDDPEARAALIERVGAKAYNQMFEDYVKATTLEVVNGYGIRPVHSQRWGRIYMIEGTGTGFRTWAEARNHANTLQPAEGLKT
jgi:hypothetical protein